jgi:hypothetical protein
MFTKFGRRIFALYEKKPLLMNTAAGNDLIVKLLSAIFLEADGKCAFQVLWSMRVVKSRFRRQLAVNSVSIRA